MEQCSPLPFSKTMAQIISGAVDEVLGQPDQTYDIQENNSLLECTNVLNFFMNPIILENEYGQRGALGLAARIGEASFQRFLRIKGDEYHLAGLDFRLMSSKQRLSFGLERLAAFVSENMPWPVDIINQQDTWIWRILPGRAPQPWNHILGSFFEGLIQEYLTWTSGGRFFLLKLMANDLSSNSVCEIKINKIPLGN